MTTSPVSSSTSRASACARFRRPPLTTGQGPRAKRGCSTTADDKQPTVRVVGDGPTAATYLGMPHLTPEPAGENGLDAHRAVGVNVEHVKSGPTCPRCGTPLRAPGLMSSDWHATRTARSSPCNPFRRPRAKELPLSSAGLRSRSWRVWPLPLGWVVTGIAHVGTSAAGYAPSPSLVPARRRLVAAGPRPHRRGTGDRPGSTVRRAWPVRIPGSQSTFVHRHTPRSRPPGTPRRCGASARCPIARRTSGRPRARGSGRSSSLDSAGHLLQDDVVLADLRDVGPEIELAAIGLRPLTPCRDPSSPKAPLASPGADRPARAQQRVRWHGHSGGSGRRRVAAGLDVVALTDHDTFWGGTRRRPRPTEFRWCPAWRCPCALDGISLHVLGYLPDPTYEPLVDELARTKEDRVPALARSCDVWPPTGTRPWDDVLAQVGPEGTVGRPHVADALVAAGSPPRETRRSPACCTIAAATTCGTTPPTRCGRFA